MGGTRWTFCVPFRLAELRRFLTREGSWSNVVAAVSQSSRSGLQPPELSSLTCESICGSNRPTDIEGVHAGLRIGIAGGSVIRVQRTSTCQRRE